MNMGEIFQFADKYTCWQSGWKKDNEKITIKGKLSKLTKNEIIFLDGWGVHETTFYTPDRRRRRGYYSIINISKNSFDQKIYTLKKIQTQPKNIKRIILDRGGRIISHSF